MGPPTRTTHEPPDRRLSTSLQSGSPADNISSTRGLTPMAAVILSTFAASPRKARARIDDDRLATTEDSSTALLYSRPAIASPRKPRAISNGLAVRDATTVIEDRWIRSRRPSRIPKIVGLAPCVGEPDPMRPQRGSPRWPSSPECSRKIREAHGKSPVACSVADLHTVPATQPVGRPVRRPAQRQLTSGHAGVDTSHPSMIPGMFASEGRGPRWPVQGRSFPRSRSSISAACQCRG